MELTTHNGYTYLIDDEDYEKIQGHHWYGVTYPGHSPLKYIVAHPYPHDKPLIKLHRLIIDAPPEFHVDHVNMNGLDNRKINIRLCTVSQNKSNMTKRRDNTSGYKGVYWNKNLRKWHVRIGVRKTKRHIGFFSSLHDAVLACDRAYVELHGEFARPNIPT